MELRHLKYFSALASELNFSRAAERLHIAQPPLSRQIRQLEEIIGVELVDRASRPIALTKAGKFFYEQTVQVLSRIDEIQAATQRIGSGQQHWFSIGFVPSTLYGLLPELIKRFRQDNPSIEVGFSELITMEQTEALKSGRIDVGFGRLHIDDPDIVCQTIIEEPLVAVFPIGHPLSKKAKVTLTQLAAENFILYPAKPRPSYADQVLKIFAEKGLRPAIVKEANEMQTAIGLVAAGVGVALVPASVQGLHRADVVYRPLSNKGVFSPVIMNFRANDNSPALQNFRSLVAGIAPTLTPENPATDD
ncbi:Aromatic hydrocarbon utilization transcriptional regulator CatR (LysR family) [Collimonas arenae]|uniref:Aromatic hydrocarbon utilization transcriptional regulator CatR (LysR family) n=1 Tax=Collimonas arenae TaxID=279058 RepID=A0A0A1F900_9BURK|nr:LysR family transcriptional regulator [Collimonas arenae]AIY39307.1 Aromatic hydrocarbon utilization transcriptional regulator CatR (LysR family) [Collimonas arenae]